MSSSKIKKTVKVINTTLVICIIIASAIIGTITYNNYKEKVRVALIQKQKDQLQIDLTPLLPAITQYNLDKESQIINIDTITNIDSIKSLILSSPYYTNLVNRLISLSINTNYTKLEIEKVNTLLTQLKNNDLSAITLESEKYITNLLQYENQKPTPEGIYLTNYTDTEFLEIGDKLLDGSIPTTPNYPLFQGENGENATTIAYNIAISRGYKYRISKNEVDLKMTAQYDKLATEAIKEGYPIALVSSFRSPDTQKGLFLTRFYDACINTNSPCGNIDIANKKADTPINQVLDTTSLPTLSKHHTGITIDVSDGETDINNFTNTRTYTWLSTNNFYNAKRFGFIPSYPPTGKNMGPNPESWEFVYVGELVNRL